MGRGVYTGAVTHPNSRRSGGVIIDSGKLRRLELIRGQKKELGRAKVKRGELFQPEGFASQPTVLTKYSVKRSQSCLSMI